MRLARQGVGIIAIADHFAEPLLRSGEILPVLPDWICPPTAAWAVFPGRRLMPRRTRVFLDAIADELDPEKCTAFAEKMRITRQAVSMSENAKAMPAAVSGSKKGKRALPA